MRKSDSLSARPAPRHALRLAKAALLWERLWAASWPASGFLGAFVALSLFDVWTVLPGWAHGAGLAALLAGAGLAVAWRLRGLKAPTDAEAERRLEQDAKLAHRPLAALKDAPATPLEGISGALWRAHRKQAEQAAREARLRRHGR